MRELLGLTGQFAAVDEILTGRENLEMFGRLFDLSPAEARAARAASCSSASTSPTPPTARRGPTPAACAAGSTSRRACSRSRASCFLDEPTTGLDPRSRNEIWAIVRELVRDGTTLLLTTQYLEEADELADRIAVIDHGRVIAEGTGNELKDRVGGQILEVELTERRQRDEAAAALARRRLRRAGAGRARRTG